MCVSMPMIVVIMPVVIVARFVVMDRVIMIRRLMVVPIRFRIMIMRPFGGCCVVMRVPVRMAGLSRDRRHGGL